MPIYEYQCNSCNHRLEKLQKISDPPLALCPSCNEPSLKKLISAAAFRLKGNGWYETDFKTGAKRNVSGDSPSSDSVSSGASSPSPSSSSSSSGVESSSNSKASEKVSATATE